MGLRRTAALGLIVGLGSGCLATSSAGHEAGGGTATTGGGQTSAGQSSGSTTGWNPCLLSLVVEPTVLDFGNTPVGSQVTQSVTIFNKSTAPVDLITLVVSGPDASFFKILNGPTSLAANAQATVELSYSPLLVEAQSVATVTFGGSGCEAATLSLLGEPVAAAFSLAPNPLDFGYQSLMSSPVRCTTATNSSAEPVTIEGIASIESAGGAFSLATTDDATPPNPFSLPLTIPVGGSAKVCFAFSPPITQQYQGEATLSSNAPEGATQALQLTGWAGGPQITCTPLSIDFGETLDHSISTIPIICTNTGTAIPGVNLLIDFSANSGSFTASFDQNSHPYPLGGLVPGQSAQIDVNYLPTAGSTDLGTLIIKSNAGTVEIPLHGQGLDVPPCQFVVAPSSIDFANVPVGETSTTLSFEIQNVGSNICLIEGLAVPVECGGAFRIVSTSIAPDATTGKITIPAPATGVVSSLVISVEFAPTVGGAASCEIAVEDGAGVQLLGTSESACLVATPVTIDFGNLGSSDAGTIQPSAPRTFQVSTECQGSTALEGIALQSSFEDTVPQFLVSGGPTLPVVISPGNPASFQVTCAPSSPGTHTAQLLISDGTLDTLLPLSCSVE